MAMSPIHHFAYIWARFFEYVILIYTAVRTYWLSWVVFLIIFSMLRCRRECTLGRSQRISCLTIRSNIKRRIIKKNIAKGKTNHYYYNYLLKRKRRRQWYHISATILIEKSSTTALPYSSSRWLLFTLPLRTRLIDVKDVKTCAVYVSSSCWYFSSFSWARLRVGLHSEGSSRFAYCYYYNLVVTFFRMKIVVIPSIIMNFGSYLPIF